MKRTFKSFFCALLSVIMAFSALSVFAAAQGENFVWWGTEYSYAGEAKLGDNSFTVSEDSLCFDFNVEKSGYYYVTLNYYQGDYNIGDISVPLTYDEESYEEKSYYYSYDSFEDNDLEKYIFKFEEGNEKLLFNLFYEDLEMTENSPLEFNVKYLGAEITGIELKNGTDKDVIYGYDLYESGYDGEYVYQNYYSLRCDYDIVFGEDSKLEFVDSYLTLGSDEMVNESGENALYAVFFDYEEVVNITVCSVSDFIEKIELFGIEDAACKVFYDGSSVGDYNVNPDEYGVVVTYKDGTKKTFNGDTITLTDGGREYYWYTDLEMEDEEAYFAIYVGMEYFGSYPCKTVKASFEENLDQLKYVISDMVDTATIEISWRFYEISFENSAWGRFASTRDALIFAGDMVVITLKDIMAEISLFMANI